MTRFSFIHGADLHLDSPFQGLREEVPELGECLWRASFNALTRLVTLALREQVDFVLLAGDLYNEQDRSLQAQIYLRRELARLARAGINTFIVHGNHDHWGGWRANLDWPEEVFFFPPDRVEGKAVYREGQELARIYGISYPRRAVTENLAALFRRGPGVPYAIALLHANLEGVSGHDNYAPCTQGQLCQGEFDYWALGHIHTPKVIRPEGPAIVYPGNIQGRSFRETGERGCYLVRVADGETTLQFHPLQDVVWLWEELDISGLEREQDLLNRLYQQVEECRSRNEPHSVFLRLTLTGRGPLHQNMQRKGFREGLLAELREITAGWEPFFRVDSLQLATGVPYDLAALSQEDSLVGDFARLLEGIATEGEFEEQFRPVLAELFDYGRLCRYLPGLDQEILAGIVEQAREIGLDLLLGEGGR